jgi:hypothetical protein
MRLFPAWLIGVLVLTSGFMYSQTPETKDNQTAETKPSEAKGLPPRASAADYQSQRQVGAVTIGAEFAGHSVPKPEGPLSTDEFVVVETGIFGAPNAKLTLTPEDFSLRINGKKTVYPGQPYGFVTRSLRDPVWQAAQEVDAKEKKEKSGSGSGLSTGGGGNNQQDTSLPVIIHVPIEMQRSMADYLRKASLPIGERPLPQAGLLFFRYAGRAQSIHSVELIYEGPAGKATIDLQP